MKQHPAQVALALLLWPAGAFADMAAIAPAPAPLTGRYADRGGDAARTEAVTRQLSALSRKAEDASPAILSTQHSALSTLTLSLPNGRGSDPLSPALFDPCVEPPGGQAPAPRGDAPAYHLPPPPGSASVALTGLLTLGAWRTLRSARQLSLAALPDWYAAGARVQIGRTVRYEPGPQHPDVGCFEHSQAVVCVLWCPSPDCSADAALRSDCPCLRLAAPRAPPRDS